jgi:alanine-glyoxylate transaminase/serine-glyoxylate transaminase/serine-pyruvate transaminase
LTAVLLPERYDEAALRALILEALQYVPRSRASASWQAASFRIGHLGNFNELMLAGTLAGVEMGLALMMSRSATAAWRPAMSYLTSQARIETHDAVAR